MAIIFPDSFEILELSIKDYSHKQNYNFQIDKNIATVSWDLLKVKEFFLLEMFVNATNDKIDVFNELEFSHRISNLKNLKRLTLKIEKPKSRFVFISKMIFSILTVLFFLIGSATLSVSSYFSFFNPDSKLQIKHSYKTHKDVQMDFINKDCMVIKDGKLIIDTIKFSQAKELIKVEPIVIYDRSSIAIGIMSTLLLILLVFGGRGVPNELINDIEKDRINRMLNK